MGEGRREVEGGSKRGGGGEMKVKGERKRRREEEEVEGGRRRGGGDEEREACEGERCVLFYWHNGDLFCSLHFHMWDLKKSFPPLTST